MSHDSNLIRSFINRHQVLTAAFGLAILTFLLIPIIFVYIGRRKVYEDIEHIPQTEYGIVFGAGVTDTGIPSTALRDRLITATALYEDGTINSILVSGDNSESHHYETDVMEEYLVEHGIPESAITVDPDGVRTYSTCLNALEDFGIDEALLITQGFHLPRAIFLCNALGVESSGVSASQREYLYENVYKLREILAIYKSLADIYLLTPS